MSTANKYHGSGREYTATELRKRRLDMVRTYLVLGYRRNGTPKATVWPYIRTEPRRHEGR